MNCNFHSTCTSDRVNAPIPALFSKYNTLGYQVFTIFLLIFMQFHLLLPSFQLLGFGERVPSMVSSCYGNTYLFTQSALIAPSLWTRAFKTLPDFLLYSHCRTAHGLPPRAAEDKDTVSSQAVLLVKSFGNPSENKGKL